MDPLFERRELSKKIHINSKFLQANIQGSILQQLKTNYELCTIVQNKLISYFNTIN